MAREKESKESVHSEHLDDDDHDMRKESVDYNCKRTFDSWIIF